MLENLIRAAKVGMADLEQTASALARGLKCLLQVANKNLVLCCRC